MKMQDVKVIAQKWGVNCRIGRTKAAVIRDIQIREAKSPASHQRDMRSNRVPARGGLPPPKRPGR
jgi:hypothetical protein